MRQKVIINQVSITKDNVLVDTDRLISVGKVRSVFSFPLKLTLSSVARTKLNPYGLNLMRVEFVKENADEK